MRRWIPLLLVALAVVSTAAAATSRAKVGVRATTLGKVLVDARGHTLYVFDQKTCTGVCAEMWPPFLTSGKPLAAGVTAAKLGMKKVAGGKLQVTFAGKLLYFYSGDSGAGQVAGASVPHWNALSPTGAALHDSSSSTTNPSPPDYTGGGGGY